MQSVPRVQGVDVSAHATLATSIGQMLSSFMVLPLLLSVWARLFSGIATSSSEAIAFPASAHEASALMGLGLTTSPRVNKERRALPGEGGKAVEALDAARESSAQAVWSTLGHGPDTPFVASQLRWSKKTAARRSRRSVVDRAMRAGRSSGI